MHIFLFKPQNKSLLWPWFLFYHCSKLRFVCCDQRRTICDSIFEILNSFYKDVLCMMRNSRVCVETRLDLSPRDGLRILYEHANQMLRFV
uniref:Uncharacterized protein n=1 Tax=Lepeophtheirus salmonis TaxID=72036 RepID=A0A0K2V5E4_LEPSM